MVVIKSLSRSEEETGDEDSTSKPHSSVLKTVKTTTRDNVPGKTKDLKSKRKENVSGETTDLKPVKSKRKENVSGEFKDLKPEKSKRKENVSVETTDLKSKRKENVSGETTDLRSKRNENVSCESEDLKSKRKENVSGESKDLKSKRKSKTKANVSGETTDLKTVNSNRKEIGEEGIIGSDSESDPDPTSSYKLQAISKTPLKRTHDEIQGPSRNGNMSEGKSVRSSTPFVPIVRLWTEADEITVLKGMIDYKKSEDHDPNAGLADFYNFIRERLQGNFSIEQLKNKISRFKKRFRNALKKREDGTDPVFARPHEVMLYDLSKKIWDVNVGKRGRLMENVKNVKKGVVEVEMDQKERTGGHGEVNFNVILDEKEKAGGNAEVNFVSKYPFLSDSFGNLMSTIPSMDLSESVMNFAIKMLSSIGNGNAEDLNGKWKQLIREELELTHKKMSLMKEQMEFVLHH